MFNFLMIMTLTEFLVWDLIFRSNQDAIKIAITSPLNLAGFSN